MYNNDLKNIEYAKRLLKNTPGTENERLLTVEEAELECVPLNELSCVPYNFLILGTTKKDGKIYAILSNLTHTMSIGSTGTGKTTKISYSLVISFIMQGRSNLVVFDNKLELYGMLANTAKEQGYTVRLINTKNYMNMKNTEKYNPLFAPSKKYVESIKKIGEGLKEEQLGGNRKKYYYKNKTYSSKKALVEAYQKEKDDIDSRYSSEMTRCVSNLMPIESTKDPHWERSGLKATVGLGIALGEDLLALDDNRRTTLSQINFYNIKKIFESFDVGRRGSLDDRGFLKNRGTKSKAYNLMRRDYFDNADVTSRNHIGFAEESLEKINSKAFMDLTMVSTVDFKEFVNSEKQILFIAYDETNKIDTALTNLLVDDIIITAQAEADKRKELKLKHPLQIVIDEFATLPKNMELVDGLTKSRSRDIHYHIVIQSEAQLQEKYGVSKDVIISNCNHIFFLGTNDYVTVKNMSTRFGEKTDIALESICNPKSNIAFTRRPVVSCSELKSGTKNGEVYIFRALGSGIKSAFVPSYEYPNADENKASFLDYSVEFDERNVYYDVSKIKNDDEDDDDDLF